MKTMISLAAFTLISASLLAQSIPYELHRYDSTDGGILTGMSRNGEWGIIQLGTSAGGGNATPKLFNVATNEASEIRYGGKLISIGDVTDDGTIIVGSLKGRPVAYNRTTGELTEFKMRPEWANATLSDVTPDGQWAVGCYNGYTGVFSENGELSGDYYFSPLLVNVQTGDTLSLPGLPQLDMAHMDQHATTFNAISPDGRYVLGAMDWYIMQPISGFSFIYDTQEHTYRVLGFTPNDETDWEPLFPGLHHIEGASFSPNGRYIGGSAYMAKMQEGSEFFNEYTVPFRYDMLTGDMQLWDDGESNNITVGAITNDGTIFGNPDSGSPLRNFRIFYHDKYWISFTQICQQVYGFNFQEKTGYEYTGTILGTTGNGQRFVTFVDPTSESYLFDFGQPLDEICSGIDLLNNYTVTPEANAQFALISNVEINFGRSVQILGNGSNIHLYKKDGTLVSNGLSNGGLTLKTGSKNTVVAAFRTRPLEAGVQYEVVIDAGAVAVQGDQSLQNHEIRIPYVGRNDAPVQIIKTTPEDGSSLRQIDNSTSYLLLDFDASIRTTQSPLAYIERVSDGSRLTTLNIAAGTTEATRHQVLLTPSSTIYLYAGEDYRLVFEAGSVTDYSGHSNSLNERYEALYHGTYVREAVNDKILFADNFNDPNASLTAWLCYEGDHLMPNATMQAWGFDADNNPWNFTLHDTETSADYFAGSHSMYSPAGASDDWMLTPQIAVPADGKALLEFDAQSFAKGCSDHLIIYVYKESKVLSHLTTDIMQQVRNQVVLLDDIILSPGQDPDLTEGEWTHYTYSLSDWAGEDIYVAFVNQNNNQSAIFVNDVIIQREVPYAIAFSNRDRVVAQDDITIAGLFTVLSNVTEGEASLILRNADGQEVSRCEWPVIPERGNPVSFSFDRPLPLIPGTEVPYTIEINMGEAQEVYRGVIEDLAFEPIKRVVLEEMTGSTCINCPLGIVAIEHCEAAFGDRFIPVAIHSYTGDNLGSGFSDYSSFLGLLGAPMARINRLPEVYSPMYRLNDEFYYHDIEGEPLWYDVVSQELDRLTLADLEVKATLSDDAQTIAFDTELRYALSASNQQLSLLFVLLEDNIESYQLNGFSGATSETMAEWCNGGRYAEYAIYPYYHNHVVRSIIGQTYSGTIGLFPSHLEGGLTYTASLTSECPSSVLQPSELSAVAMLIDTQTGQVINAAKTQVRTTDAIHEVKSYDMTESGILLRDLSGTIILHHATEQDLQQLPAGIYLFGGRKVIIR